MLRTTRIESAKTNLCTKGFSVYMKIARDFYPVLDPPTLPSFEFCVFLLDTEDSSSTFNIMSQDVVLEKVRPRNETDKKARFDCQTFLNLDLN